MSERLEGIVLRFDPWRGYGIIRSSSGEKFYVHRSELRDVAGWHERGKTLKVQQEVTFERKE